jgi:DNA-binding protein HU-beta
MPIGAQHCDKTSLNRMAGGCFRPAEAIGDTIVSTFSPEFMLISGSRSPFTASNSLT